LPENLSSPENFMGGTVNLSNHFMVPDFQPLNLYGMKNSHLTIFIVMEASLAGKCEAKVV
jgi:hypothetical protein